VTANSNIIAVAGTAHGSIILLIAGLLFSMPLLMTTGGAVSLLIEKCKWLTYLGAFAITFTATRMVLEDRFIEARFQLPSFIVIATAGLVGFMVPALFMWLNKRRKSARTT